MLDGTTTTQTLFPFSFSFTVTEMIWAPNIVNVPPFLVHQMNIVSILIPTNSETKGTKYIFLTVLIANEHLFMFIAALAINW